MPLQEMKTRPIKPSQCLGFILGWMAVCLVGVEAYGSQKGQSIEQASPQKLSPHDSEGLSFFFDKLRDTESQKGVTTRIAWWGDSAILGDGYTREVRKRLQARFGNAGPGFVPLAPGSAGFLRAGVRLKHRGWEVHNVLLGLREGGYYGYGGVASSSWGGATTTLTLRDQPIDRVVVFYRATAHSGLLRISPSAEKPNPYEIHSCKTNEGEEASDRIWALTYQEPISEIQIRAAGKGLVRAYGVALERDAGGVVLDAMGILGMRARRWKRALASHLARQIQLRNVDLLVVNFGGNERVDPGLTVDRHREELAEIVERFRAGHPEASCLVVGPIAHGNNGQRRLDPALEVIYEAQRKVAKEKGCAFFDTVFAMGGENAVQQFRKKRLMGRDLAHLNSAGHQLVGSMLSDWLIQSYDARPNGADTDGIALTPATPAPVDKTSSDTQGAQ